MNKPTDERSTPQPLFDYAHDKYGPFDIDVCAARQNAKLRLYYTLADNGLVLPWTGRVWCNPPYSRGNQRPWIERAVESTMPKGPCELACLLLPSDTSTAHWHDLVIPYADSIEYVRGRVKFNGAEAGAKFGSAFVVFRRAA